MEKYFLYNPQGILTGEMSPTELETLFSELDIKDLKQDLLNRISTKGNIEISKSEIDILLSALRFRVKELLQNPEFDPQKSNLRKLYPEQFSQFPFDFEGQTYYLYFKGPEFKIDQMIDYLNRMYLFLKSFRDLNLSSLLIYKN